MTPLNPVLRRLLRNQARSEAPLPAPPLGLAARIVGRARAEGALVRDGTGAAAAASQDPILATALAFSLLLIVSGATVFLGDLDRSVPTPAWVSASQFAASQFLP